MMKYRLAIAIMAAALCLSFAVSGGPSYAQTKAPVQRDAEQDFWGLDQPLNKNTRNVKLKGEESEETKIVPVDEYFTSADGKKLRLTMTGLSNENKASMLDSLGSSYVEDGEGSAAPLRIENASFVDAEKWNNHQYGLNDYFYGYDVEHCWAASCANMLWLSGWTEGLINPRTGIPFKSEDDIFEYYNINFTDKGSETDRAIDWFFMGEFFLSGSANSASPFRSPSGGLMKDFVSSAAQKQYDLVEAPEDIGNMLKVAAEDPDDRAVFEVGIGAVDGEVSDSQHAITGIGLITDPDADDMADKYKAIILADSDNDGEPSDEEKKGWTDIMKKYDGLEPFSEESNAVTDELVQYMEAKKENRPNTYTVYKLRYAQDANGTPYWEVVGYVSEAAYAIIDLDELPCRSDKVIAGNTEEEGSKDADTDVDFTLDELFTTSKSGSAPDPYLSPAVNAKKSVFGKGVPVNVNYFLANRSNVILDASYPGGNRVTVDWKVTRESDGAVVASGSERQAFTNYMRLEEGAMLFLNKTEQGYEIWEPGTYTVTISFNKDRAFREAYYKNNYDRTLSFTVTEEDPQGLPKEIKPAVILSSRSYTYSGKAKKPAVTVKDGKDILVKDVDYTVSYAPGRINVGKYKVTVNLMGSCKGSGSSTFKINPKGTGLKNPKRAEKAITVRWNKQSAKMSKKRITGYRIQLAYDRKFTRGKKTVTVKGYTKTSKKITGLKGGKKYYVRICTYRKIGSTAYYSPWSKVKAATAGK